MGKTLYEFIEESIKNRTFRHSVTNKIYEIDSIDIFPYSMEMYVLAFDKDGGKYVNFSIRHLKLLEEVIKEGIDKI